MSAIYLLDTNMVGYAVRGRSPAARLKMEQEITRSVLFISTITEAEILFGLARKPEATRLREAMDAFFATVSVLAWDSGAARAYATLQVQMAESGRSLGNMDMLIAAHALAIKATLVTADKAFSGIDALRPVENWATDL